VKRENKKRSHMFGKLLGKVVRVHMQKKVKNNLKYNIIVYQGIRYSVFKKKM